MSSIEPMDGPRQLDDINWRAAEEFLVGTSEPDGGTVMLSMKVGPTHYVGVEADSTQARNVAAGINKLADIVEKSEQK